MRVSKLLVLGALVSAFCLAATASASADSTTCTAEGKVKLSPGLTETPAVQNIQIKGTLSGCTGESEVTEGKFQIHEKTAEAVTCKALTEGAAASSEEASIKLKWKPKPAEGPQSQGTASVSLIEGPAALSGTITSGPFNEDAVSGSLTQAYTGGPECGKGTEHNGKMKKAKKVNKGTATGTISVS